MIKLNYTDMLAQLGIHSAHPGGMALTKRIVSNEPIDSDLRILEIGCGTGQTAAYLAKNYRCHITAIDPHETMIKKAKKNFAKELIKVELIQGKAEHLPFEDNLFDLVIAESVLAFTILEQSLVEIYRVLKTNGKLITIDMTVDGKLSPSEINEIQEVYGTKKILRESEWETYFVNAGFLSVDVEKDELKDSDQLTAPLENDPSDFIDPTLFKIIETHIQLTQKYKERLGYRIFRCVK